MTQVDFSLLSELLGNELVKLGFFLLILFLFYAGFVVAMLSLFNCISDRVMQKRQVKVYLQQHRFEHFRSIPFLDGSYAIVEDVGADSAPLVISYINNGLNAERICEILNCDYLGEVYTPEKVTRLFNCSIQRFEKDKKVKTPENEGERS